MTMMVCSQNFAKPGHENSERGESNINIWGKKNMIRNSYMKKKKISNKIEDLFSLVFTQYKAQQSLEVKGTTQRPRQ